MTTCSTPQPARTVALRLAVLRFAVRRGFTRQLLRYRKAIAGYVALSAVFWACGLLQYWGQPVTLAGWFLIPFGVVVVGGLLGVALSVATSEAWYYSPAPGKRSMLMMWPRWRIFRPDKRIAGNWVAEPQGEGVGRPLFEAVIADVDRRGIWLYGTAANDDLLKFYLSKGCERRNDKLGMVRKSSEVKLGE
jgi:hypothetical protein